MSLALMATPHDDRAKKILDVLLDGLGELTTEFEVPLLPSQRADAFFVPDAAHEQSRRSLGLIGRMTNAPCLFEFFSGAPGAVKLRACLRKALNHTHSAELKGGASHAFAARAWIVCAGRPSAVLARCRATRAPGWPRGFYHLWAHLPVWVVVLSELPKDSPDTLPLRLMGAGDTLRGARAQLAARSDEVPRGAELMKLMVQIWREARRRATPTEEVMVDLSFANAIEQRGIEKGIEKGIETMFSLLVRQVERRLARTITPTERGLLRRRFDAEGAERVSDALVDLDADALAQWVRVDGAP